MQTKHIFVLIFSWRRNNLACIKYNRFITCPSMPSSVTHFTENIFIYRYILNL